ncbi:MAG: GDSL-type esterase/lipase family protein [Candidatus Cloacimonetes bacterium]|nr:GDSL-type esterase/lipase family protein [Candidatus Cloacimonadota bacterium]
MKHQKAIFLFVLSMFFMLILNTSSAQENTESNYMDELFSAEEYPPDMDTLEEFIQSYYLLLDSNEYLKKFKYVNQDKNLLQNDSTPLKGFYEKLMQLRSGLRDRVSIYQIGDSHIQSGYFPGTARSSLQKYFGNAGRGLVFPLRAAGTNQPDDYRISSSGGLSRNNNTRGISGYALNSNSNSSMELSTNNFFNTDNSFNKLSVISAKPGLSASVKQSPSSVIDINWGDYRYSSVSWNNPLSKVSLSISGEPSVLYGLMLEKTQPGLLYHSAGVNGAGFYNLLDSPHLFKQIGILNPDLIVISLGTNDAQGRYRNEQFSSNLNKFMRLLRQDNPDTPVLFTLPPDSNKQGKHNSDLAKLEKTLINFAKDNNCAWWNLTEVMGGKGSVSKWRKEQMASKDLLHYTPKGYMLQGYLFYQAVVKSYKKYSENTETMD